MSRLVESSSHPIERAPAAAQAGGALALQAKTPAALLAAFPGMTIDEARKIVSAVHREKPLSALAGVRRVTLEAVRARGEVPSLEVVASLASAVDPFAKLALKTNDGHVIEAVRIPLEREGRFSACVSSQVGCALACAFCATGRLGLTRNLATWEIVEQMRALKRTLKDARPGGDRGDGTSPVGGGAGGANPPLCVRLGARARIHGVVFQGMGEPMSNLDRVLEAIAVMSDPCALAIDARAMTVCTAGVPSGIRRLAREAPRVRLGWSVGSARESVRRSLMPITNANPIGEVLDAIAEHARLTELSPMWAVTPLAGVNDTDDDARALADLARRFVALSGGIRPRISVIPYNAIAEDGADPFARAADARMLAFRAALYEQGFGSHIRYSGGADVNAACGQLAAKI